MICTHCKKSSKELHKHHIVPRSRGGTDDDDNIVLLCIDCHGLAHDASFKSRNGLIASGIQKVRDDQKAFNDLDNGEILEVVGSILDEIYTDADPMGEVLDVLLSEGLLDGVDIYRLFFTDQGFGRSSRKILSRIETSISRAKERLNS